MSANLGFIALAQEPLASYAVDAIDPNGSPDVDLEFQRFRSFRVSKNQTQADVAMTLPSYSRHPHVTIPQNLAVEFESTIFEARDPGVAGGEAPPGFLEVLVGAGFSSDIAAPGGDLVLTPSSEPTASYTAYSWERNLFGDSPTWSLWRLRGVRNERFSFGGAVNAPATFDGSGQSANFPRDISETAKPHGRTLPLAFFDLENSDLLLDQFGDAVAWTGSWEHALYTPMVTTFARITLAGAVAPVQDWRVNIENTPYLRPIEVGGEMMWEVLFAPGRTLGFNATLKDRDTYLDLVESVRANLSGTPGDELVELEVVMDDGKGAGGTTYQVAAKMQFAEPTENDQDGVKNWTIDGLATPDWSTSFAGDDELTVTVSQTA